MDLLGGYGSGSDSEPESPRDAGAQGRVTLLANSAPEPQEAPAARQAPDDPSKLLTSLPAPAGSKVGTAAGAAAAACSGVALLCSSLVPMPPGPRRQQQHAQQCTTAAAVLLWPHPSSAAQAPLFSGLPKPAAKKRVAVQFRVPISYDPADVKGDPDEVRRGGSPAGSCAAGAADGEWPPGRAGAAAAVGRWLRHAAWW